ncbi:asparaginase [Curtobacterium flaccumfaciens]|nr:asparaginase [Curtobacterium flaccumfaciens]
MKPFQALAIRRAGAVFSDEELVLTTASHAGTAAHQALALHMLESFDHVESDLGCPPDLPFDRATARTMVEPRRLAMNCSGKHAGMLAACRVNGWDDETYLDIAHPLQQRVRSTVEEFTHETADVVGTDGCGAPVFPLTLAGLARGFAAVVARAEADTAALTDAVLDHPWAIDGIGRANTVTIERLRVLAKLGAEGVMVMGLPGGAAVAVKTLDGAQRAGTLAALTLLDGTASSTLPVWRTSWRRPARRSWAAGFRWVRCASATVCADVMPAPRAAGARVTPECHAVRPAGARSTRSG